MSLTRIESASAAQNSAMQLHAADNVAIAKRPLRAGQLIRVAGRTIQLKAAIPAGHKFALNEIGAGLPILRYGEQIGTARGVIRTGEHIHLHNAIYHEIEFGYEFPKQEAAARIEALSVPTFMGYARRDGRVGTRNYIVVAAASNCAAHVAGLVAAHFRNVPLPDGVDGVAVFPHADGCGHAIGPDTQQLHRTISGLLDHPNVAGAVLIGLGCEVNLLEGYFPAGTRQTEHLTGLTIQESGGTTKAVSAGIAAVEKHIERAAEFSRTAVSASKIILGLNCGGSDSFSGITANPALGLCSDMLAGIGATAVLGETPEIVGAEHLLIRRARNREVASSLLGCIERYREYLRRFGGNFDDNPAPGNKDGGLTNIVEKSLGAVAKGGSSPLMSVVEYADRIASEGLVFMNTPGYDPVSITGLAAGGVNVIAFTTGRGSAIGFPTVPVIKIATNTSTFERMRDNMDLNAGRILDGEASLEDVGLEILQLTLDVASGKHTASERLGHGEFVPWRIGPVL